MRIRPLIRFFVLFLFFIYGILNAEEEVLPTSSLVCFFTPPTGWEISFPKESSSHVQVLFVKPKVIGFQPSINLSIETTSASLEEYLKIIKDLHEQDREKEWSLLGKMQTQSGLAQLTQINTPSEWGPVRLLQLILIKQGKAYILTAAALKKEFSLYYSLFHKALRSMTLTRNLIDNLPLLEKRDQLQSAKENLLTQPQKESSSLLHSFAKEIHESGKELGPYWEYLVLKETQEAVLARKEEGSLQEDKFYTERD